MARLELVGVEKTFPGGIPALRGVDLTVEDGELFVIVGPSGSGKSTILRLVAGLERPDSGSMSLDGLPIENLAPRDRDVAMVFQDQLLYPHLDVFENMAFGLRARRVGRPEIEERVRATASILKVADCLGRRPETLSGGQRRRVALGRALVLRPRLFLMDEPFSGLDAPLRASTRSELVELHRTLGTTMILVTHDQAEALAIGDRVAVLDQGRLLQVGRPLELYDLPSSRTVARFIGQPEMNLLSGELARSEEGLELRIGDPADLPVWTIRLDTRRATKLLASKVSRVQLGLRPEQISVIQSEAARPGPGGPSFASTVRRLEPMGSETLAFLAFGTEEIVARLSSGISIRAGDPVMVEMELGRAHWFDPASGDRLA
ncbi:ABC transporter ATP-binding protein [Tundrisphaera lichenicola]|uniref:ABC transporter ATP-binding protein n=1 Tax=Tundrisphaera lichenicola TaxID=2029860 RepID=UPI003EB92736